MAVKKQGRPAVKGVATADRVLTVLTAFKKGDGTLSLAELSHRTGLVKSTIMRLAVSLEKYGLVARVADSGYRLDAEVFRLGMLYRQSFRLENFVRPVLEELVARLGETASFYVRRGDQRQCLFRVESPHLLRLHIREGDMLPLEASATSQVLRIFGSKPMPAYAPGERVSVVPMTAMRKKIAEHMILSQDTSAHVTQVTEVDMQATMKLRARHKQAFEERNGAPLTVTAFMVRAAVEALKAFPVVNASVDGDNIVYKKDFNIGVAVALDWGLIVPVIKNAGDLSLSGIAKAVRDLADRARAKKLSPDEVQGGTFTITNPGVFGSLFGTPIINQPQVAIMGVGSIDKRPVVVDDAIAIHSICYMTLSFDHRLIDGAVGAQFMSHVKETLEEARFPDIG